MDRPRFSLRALVTDSTFRLLQLCAVFNPHFDEEERKEQIVMIVLVHCMVCFVLLKNE